MNKRVKNKIQFHIIMIMSVHQMNKGKIRELAGISTFSRGEQLAKSGHVYGYHQEKHTITAQVQGHHLYDVRIDNLRQFTCSCPAAEYQTICKHAVATLLVNLGEHTSHTMPEPHANIDLPNEHQIHTWLSKLNKKALIAIIEQEYQENPDLWDQLQQRCFIETQETPLTKAQVALLIENALPYDAAWDYDETKDYFNTLSKQIEILETALNTLPANQRAELAWQAIQRLNTVCMEYVDSSHGDYCPALHVFQTAFVTGLTQSDDIMHNKLALIIEVIHHDLDLNYDFLDQLTTHYPAIISALQSAIISPSGELAITPLIQKNLCDHFRYQAEKHAQWEEAIEWQLRTQLDWHAWLTMGRYYTHLTQYEHAERCLQQARKLNNDNDSRCSQFECDLAQAMEDHPRHWAIRVELFKQNPFYSEVKHLDELAAIAPDVAQEYQTLVVSYLEDKIKEDNTIHHLALLIDCALRYKNTTILNTWGMHPRLAQRTRPLVADAIASINYPLACTLYETSITHIIEESNNEAYLYAVSLLAQYQDLPATNVLQHKKRWDGFVKATGELMKRKRNFIRYLNERFE